MPTDTVLQKLKGKILLRTNKSSVQNFPRYKSKCSDQNTKAVRFYPWKVDKVEQSQDT